MSYTLKPLSRAHWDTLKEEIEKEEDTEEPQDMPGSETNSIAEDTRGGKGKGIVLDASREVRLKLYTGQVFTFLSCVHPC